PAENGAEALEKLRSGTFDLIISDILMPSMDGFQLCRNIRNDPTLLTVPLIFYTATYTGPQDEEFAFKIGADGFIRKPCEPEELLAQIESVMRKATKQDRVDRESQPEIEEVEIYKLYNERLVRKLEQKMQALELEKQRFQTLVDESPLGVVLVDKEDRVRYVNPRFTEIFGYSLEDIPDRNYWFGLAYPDPDYRREIISTWRQAQENAWPGSVRDNTCTARTRDGAEKLIHVRAAFQESGDQIILYEDVTQQKRLEDRLRQAQKMEAIGALAGGIAHDFNNILAAIIGYGELLKMELPEASPTQEYVQEVLKAGNRAKDLIKHILTFSRQTEHAHIPMLVHLVVKEALKLLRSTLPTTIEIREQVAPSGMILGDPTQIHQVIMNLCTNAFHAMEETGGVLEIGLEAVTLDHDLATHYPELTPGLYIRLTVSDTGCGMTPDIEDKIFDPYFTTKEEGKGTGLGLAVLHGIVQSHGGAVTVYSEPGKGSVFRIYLPQIETDPEEEAVIEEKRLPLGSERILFVDDEQVLTGLGKSMLQSLGYQVISRTSSLEALECFRHAPEDFDLVITDLTMPQMTGIELTRELLQIRPEIPVVLCTGFSQSLSVLSAKKMGIQEVVMKPFIRKDLAVIVRRVLDAALKIRPNDN
ncbi:MAG: response regulator, partial [Deltaproteobacteria bacterium]|nr:response regulator [Deltaproteobacteria bacterium]